MQTSEHAVTTSPSNPRRAANRLVAGMIATRNARRQNPFIEPTVKQVQADILDDARKQLAASPAVKPTAKQSAKKSARKATVAPVTLRKLARDFGQAKKGTIALILNPAVFGSSDGSNWLGGRTYADVPAALAAAKAAGATVLNPPAK